MRRAASLLAMTAVVTAACGREAPAPASSTATAAEPAGWSELERSPLSARYGAVAFWTGTEVLVIGGTDAAPCPPNADCLAPPDPPLRDGAALDPGSGRWRSIADAPRPVARAPGAVAGDALYLLIEDALLRYRVGADRWEVLPAPPGETSLLQLSAIGSDLLAYHSTQEFGVEPDAVFDTATGRWSPVPVDPLADAYDRAAVWTGRGVVLLAIPLEVRAPNAPPLVAAAVLDPGSLTWRRLPDSTITGGATGWGFAGDHVVNASIGSADGGEVNNWGREHPFGGMLGPAGVWSDLPDPPDESGGFPGVASALGDFAIADGWALHVPSGSWTEIESPGIAPTEAAVTWTGSHLVVWGGVAWNGNKPTILDTGLVWRP